MKCKLSSLVAITLLCATVSIVSCKKEGSKQTQVSQEEAQTISEEQAATETEYDEVTEMGLTAGADLEAGAIENGRVSSEGANARVVKLDVFINLKLRLGAGVIITAEPNDTTFPKTITINYGDGTLCWDGKLRKGIVKLYFSAPIRKPGSTITITLDNYYVNRAHIEGVKTITNLSANGSIAYSVSIEGGKVTRPNGRGFSIEGTKTVTQVNGQATATCLDDVYSIEGNMEIHYANGVTVTKSIVTPLLKPVACNWIASGKVQITINDREFSVEFGTGVACDNKALLVWANGQVEFTLP